MLSLRKVFCDYGNFGNDALKNVSFEVSPGEVIGILGENGAGKTTLLKAIMGLVALRSGVIEYAEEPVCKRYEKVAYITGEGSFFPWQTPQEYAKFLCGFYPAFDMQRYDKLLEFFELSADKPIGKMSMGQKTKAELAAGLSRGADLILMDEPLFGKDMFTRQDFLKLLCGSLHGSEIVLLSTHQIKDIENFIDRAIIMREGSVGEIIEMDALREQNSTLEEAMKRVLGYNEDRFVRIFG
jgi:ABC-2 type transport system ATP-binding protein